MSSDITVCIPTILPRRLLLGRAVASVMAQTLLPDAVAVAVDTDHDGVWVTRARAVAMADTRWVAMLDDDDEFLPPHLERLLACAEDTDADLVYPWFETVPPGQDVLGLFGKPFDPEHAPATVTGTVLVDRQLASSVELGPPNPGEVNANDDHRLLHGAIALGAKIVHLPERTWLYHHHGVHTSGQPHRW